MKTESPIFLRSAARLILSVSLCLASFPPLPLRAAVPPIFNYQGKLSDVSGTPVTNEVPGVSMEFRIFDDLGNLLTSYRRDGFAGSNRVPVVNGVFSVLIGDASDGTVVGDALDLALGGAGDRFLEIVVNGAALTPRQRLAAVPYAMSVADGAVGTAQLADGGVTIQKLEPGLLDWNNLSGIPGGFLDGVDDGGIVDVLAGGSPVLSTLTLDFSPPLTVTDAGGVAQVGLAPSVTILGNAVNAPGGLVQLDGSGAVPFSVLGGTESLRTGIEAASASIQVLPGPGLSGGGSLFGDLTLELDTAGLSPCDTSPATGKVFWDGARLVCGTDDSGAGGTVSGLGTTNRMAKWTSGSGTLGDSSITDNGVLVSVGAALNVAGSVSATGFSGDGAGLTNVNAETVNGFDEGDFALATHTHAANDISSGVFSVNRGGTGITSYTSGNYIRAQSAALLEQRTPAQVLGDIGAAAITHTHDLGTLTGTVSAANGGTGQTSLIANAVLVGNGTSPVSSVAMGVDQVLVGRAGLGPVGKTLQGTPPNRVSVTSAAGAITLDLPQDIGKTSNVDFGDVTAAGVVLGNTVTSQGTLTAQGNAVVGDGTGTDVLSFNGTSGRLSLPTGALSADGQARYNAGGGVLEFRHGGTARALQNRLTTGCTVGNFLAGIDADGTPDCEPDNVGGGAVQVREGGAPIVAAMSALDFNGADFNVAENPPSSGIAQVTLGTVPVPKGGTGQTTFTPNGVLLGNGTGNLGSTAVMTDTQVLGGRTGTTPTGKTLQGTSADRISVTPAAGSITLDLPQDLGKTSNVEFGNILGNGTLSFGASGRLTAPSSVTSAGQIAFSGNNLIYRDSGATQTVVNASRVVNTSNGLFGGNNLSGNLNLQLDTAEILSCTSNTQRILWSVGTNRLTCVSDPPGTVTAVESNDGSVVPALQTLDFSTQFAVSQSPVNEANVSLANNSVTSSIIQDGQVQTNDIGDDQVTPAKVQSGTNGQFLTTSGGNAQWTSMSGDGQLNNAGALTIQADAVALGGDTTGNFLASLTQGNGILVTGAGAESANPTVAINLGAACTGNDKLRWTGTGFACAADQDTNSGGTVTSVAPGVGLTSSGGGAITSAGTLNVSLDGIVGTSNGLVQRVGTNAYSTTANNSANWDTGFSERRQWDGGGTNLNQGNGRTSLGLGALATLGAVGSAEITNGSIADADISGTAGIQYSKMAGGGPSCPAGQYIQAINAAGVETCIADVSGGSPTGAAGGVLNGTYPNPGLDTVDATTGGTGQTSVVTGDLLFGSATNTWSRRGIGAAGQVLTVVGGTPSWATVPASPPSGAAAGDLAGTYPNPTIAPNSVALATDTTGNFVASVANAASGGLTVSGSGEGAAVTVGLAGARTSNFLPKWNGTSLVDSIISDNGTVASVTGELFTSGANSGLRMRERPSVTNPNPTANDEWKLTPIHDGTSTGHKFKLSEATYTGNSDSSNRDALILFEQTNGNVSIGGPVTDSTGGRLTVTGNAFAALSADGTNAGFAGAFQGDVQITAAGSHTGTLSVASLAGTGNRNVQANPSGMLIPVASDGRLKDVQGDYSVGLSSVLQLSPKLYKWKKGSQMDDGLVHAGFIAQEVEKAVPEAVMGRTSDGFMTFEDRPIIAALVNAIKEQQAQIDALKAELERLRKE